MQNHGYWKEIFHITRRPMERGADVDGRDKKHESPLLIWQHAFGCSKWLAGLLLQHGTDVSVKSSEGKAPLPP